MSNRKSIYLVPVLAIAALCLTGMGRNKAQDTPTAVQEPSGSTSLAGLVPGCPPEKRAYVGHFVSARALKPEEMESSDNKLDGADAERIASGLPIFRVFAYDNVVLYICPGQDFLFIGFPPEGKK